MPPKYKSAVGRTKNSSSNFLDMKGDSESNFTLKTKIEHINIDDIILPDTVKEDPQTTESIRIHGQIFPVLLRHQTIEEEKFGAKVRVKTGKYLVMDKGEIVAGLRSLYAVSKEEKYQYCMSMVISEAATEEEIEEIRKAATSGEATKSIQEIVEGSTNLEVNLQHDFEEVYLRPEDLRFEYNTFTYTDAEIDMLADSIVTYGMWDLPLVLPYLSKGKILYRIIAGHKRIKSVLKAKENARNNIYPNSEEVLRKLSKIKVRLLPLGATKEQVDAVHEYSNLMRRQLSIGDALTHIGTIKQLPPVPTTEEEYKQFTTEYSIRRLVEKTESYFKALGFSDWKDRKTSRFLTVYYYGCDRLKDVWKLPKPPLTQKEMVWIATTYKGFGQREEQADVVEKALENKNYLLALMNEETVRRKGKEKASFVSVNSTLLSYNQRMNKWKESGLERISKTEKKTLQKHIEEIEESIAWLKQKVES
jgi:hypothetical protein